MIRKWRSLDRDSKFYYSLVAMWGSYALLNLVLLAQCLWVIYG